MKKVKNRAWSSLIIALALVALLAVYLVKLADNGGAWATYFNGGTPAGTIIDRNGVTLYSSDENGVSYSADATTRLACYHLIGDANGNVRTGALRQFRDMLSGYSFINGTSSGKTLQITVDSSLNAVAYNALAGRNGAVMLMDYTTGEILCMVSTPADDPQNPSESPADGTYINKCLSASFVPGSVFKLVTLAAAIENIPDLFERTFWCEGSSVVGGAVLNCTGSHGNQTIEQALANSCNCAFGAIALELGADTIAEYAEKLGLTQELSLDGMTVTAGSFDKAEEGSIGLAWSGIGQYNDMVVPYALVRYVAAIANGGSVYEPNLLGHGNLDRESEILSADTASRIAEMMNYNVQNAYGGQWTFPGLNVSAKTGTAEVGDGTSHAWMTGFLNDPTHPYAFVVLVENAGGGLTNAAPIVNQLLQAAIAE
ncbi:MAG TPA: penicillin-binding protein [Candidatus Scatomorpha merdigallinarum]|nr:penicillin-binding protein [Candidatus Scatomorpha merdigallinarum]